CLNNFLIKYLSNFLGSVQYGWLCFYVAKDESDKLDFLGYLYYNKQKRTIGAVKCVTLPANITGCDRQTDAHNSWITRMVLPCGACLSYRKQESNTISAARLG
ncbi:hypothetical protein, partial [Hydrogenoanaerobacterium sp.]|uniref:hypothetical protein n=1 Tax=Hydrogenoanaerobacterium sp. TaxID=2953763 RepID=UPI0028A00336